MNNAYSEHLASFSSGGFYSRTVALQLCFVLYLLLGQFLILAAWRLVMRPGRPGAPPTTWKGRLAFVLYLLLAQVVLFLAWPQLVGLWLVADKVRLADILVTVHLALVLACLLLLVLLPVGAWRGWGWTRHFWLRLAHLAFIELVAGQALVGLECPLLTVERDLREKSTVVVSADDRASDVGRFCNKVLYAPNGSPWWVMALAYSAVGLGVLLTWLLIPPAMPWREGGEARASVAGPNAWHLPPQPPGSEPGETQIRTADAQRGEP